MRAAVASYANRGCIAREIEGEYHMFARPSDPVGMTIPGVVVSKIVFSLGMIHRQAANGPLPSLAQLCVQCLVFCAVNPQLHELFSDTDARFRAFIPGCSWGQAKFAVLCDFLLDHAFGDQFLRMAACSF
jgi:hypothetical protein